ncbi:universal stress protein [Terasakiella sp. A23]|uniref:universal stress protein n=1 Tax=Terasakiella sp. FCG-A23 TaxID=3080561 RepID=UPI002955A401|nr:universal stress protein [Terasakiella sp. A23]MDV7339254.1 universal stress protein [Terasakiella sp. A23]
MYVKSILAPIDGGNASGHVMCAARVLAKALHAHINVLYVMPDPKAAIPLLGEGMSGAMIEDMIGMAEKEGAIQRDKARSFFKTVIAESCIVESEVPSEGEQTTVTWIEDEGREDEVIARYGRLNDLILVPKPVKDTEIYSTLALNAALFETGRPMMLLPEREMTDFPKVMAVCWNGSVEGARAVASALGFLKMADEVHVITADTSATPAAEGDELKRYLSWHGISAKSVFFSPAGKSVGEALLEESKKQGADMMVMGGYSHSRMRELILGGVTRDVIQMSDIPVIMGH